MRVSSNRKGSITSWMIVPVMGIVWIVALLYGSGIGQVYDIYGKANLVVIIFCLQMLANGYYRYVSQNTALVLMLIVASNITTQLLYDRNMFDYLWLYLLIPLISSFSIEEKPMMWVSIMYGILGMSVLYVINFGSAFDGWNSNSLAMVAFFSFTVMISFYNETNNIGVFLLLGVYYAIYYKWSEPLGSRSGAFFTIIMLLGVFKIIPFKKWLSKRSGLTMILLAPLIIAIILVLIRGSDFVQKLELWSYATFNKPIFNGRDVICRMGFEQWLQHPIIGIGDLSVYNWHNSAITVLVGGGIVGLLLWIFGTRFILEKGIPYLQDNIVFGLMLGFIMIWLQQSVELGLVAGQANAIPYAMLGLLVGRVNTLRREAYEAFNYNSGL